MERSLDHMNRATILYGSGCGKVSMARYPNLPHFNISHQLLQSNESLSVLLVSQQLYSRSANRLRLLVPSLQNLALISVRLVRWVAILVVLCETWLPPGSTYFRKDNWIRLVVLTSVTHSSTNDTQMPLDVFISRIPLVLAYPTVLLSSNLIVSVAGGSNNDGKGLLEPLLRSVIAPIICASTVAATGGILKVIERPISAASLAFVS